MKPRPHREKFDAARREIFLDLLRKGVRRTQACKKAGISRPTFNKCMNNNKKFAAEVAQAETDANELVEQAMFSSALKGNVTAQQVWLYNRDPDRWSDKRNSQLDIQKFEFEVGEFKKALEELDALKAKVKQQ
jgi:hypothetical protein